VSASANVALKAVMLDDPTLASMDAAWVETTVSAYVMVQVPANLLRADSAKRRDSVTLTETALLDTPN